MPAKLTVIIPCKDERINILDCITSVGDIADELIVADSGSTDGTLEMVRQLGSCRIIEREYVNPASFKNWAIPHATHPWVLIVDADERLSQQLVTEIRDVLSEPPGFDGYRVRFQPFFLGHPIRYCGWTSSHAIRLFRKEVGRYAQNRVHESLKVSTGRVADLRGKFLHFTAWDIARYIAKQNRYTTWSAEDRHERGGQTSVLKLLMKAPVRFLQLYLLRGGLLDGCAGLVLCMLAAYYSFLKEAKIWALDHAVAAPQGAPQQPSSSAAPDPLRLRGAA